MAWIDLQRFKIALFALALRLSALLPYVAMILPRVLVLGSNWPIRSINSLGKNADF